MAITDSINCNTRVRDVAHMEWIAAEVDSEYALHAWYKADMPEAAAAYVAYRAAAEREEAAARDLQRLSDLTQPQRTAPLVPRPAAIASPLNAARSIR